MKTAPSYLELHRSGELARRIEAARQNLRACTLCPWHCRVDRLEGKLGVCKTGPKPVVSSYGPHFGEEKPLVGRHGSGTIFLSGCNLHCLFCQNYDISQLGVGEEITEERLGGMMVELWRQGCHNINYVTPSHQVAQILAALPFAIEAGLDVPLVYNCGGYEDLDTLRLLDGVFDIYMPDFKFADNRTAQRLCGPRDYADVAKGALREMHRQVGDLELDGRGIAVRGLLVRHLVLPEELAGTRQVVGFLARELSPDTYLNLMDQYRPCYRAADHPPLDRPLTRQEFAAAVAMAREEGLRRLEG